MMNIDILFKIIKERQKNMPKDSYVALLLAQGQDRVIQKVGEEAVEVVIAAKNKAKKQIISEVADLLFHVLVLLVVSKISLSEVFNELDKRNNK